MEQPVRPMVPKKTPEHEDLINHAMAIAIVEIKKALKEKVTVKTSICTWRDWSDLTGEIIISIQELKEVWDKYREDYEKYVDDCADYEAHKLGITREEYDMAKTKLEEYNRKKCESAEARDLEYYVNLIKEGEIVIAS